MIKLEDLTRKDFKPENFYFSNTAKINKIDNTPKSFAILQCLLKTADKCQEIQNKIEGVNKELKLIILSCYRNPEINKLVKGSKNSKHLQGLAVDFLFAKKNSNNELSYKTSEESMELIFKTGVTFDKLLLEKGCVHIQFSLREEENKNLVGKAELINGKWLTNFY